MIMKRKKRRVDPDTDTAEGEERQYEEERPPRTILTDPVQKRKKEEEGRKAEGRGQKQRELGCWVT